MSSLPISVLKFGSSVLRGPDDLATAVHEIYRELRDGRRVVAVVSAFEGVTDRRLASAHGISRQPSASALALLASTGETQSVALLAVALERAGVPAVAFDAARAGIRTRGSPLDAEPFALDVAAIERELERGAVAVVPGFVGRHADGSTSLFGRGGSDLTALFVAHRLRARTCRLLKDVDGVYDTDPSSTARARRFEMLTFGDARALGARVVQARALRFAEEQRVEFDVSAPSSVSRTRVGAESSVPAEPPSSHRPLRVGLLGLGTVGLGVYRELARFSHSFEVRRVLVRRRRRRAGIPARLVTTDLDGVLGARCDVIVEVLGGLEPASSAITAALERGISVVTANKAAVALHGRRWREIASSTGARFSYSAAVGGAVPMLEVVRSIAREQRIVAIEGVVNATTNFVLDLVEEGLDLDAAVARANDLGYCEADPRTDLDGTDAAHKLELLAREAFGDTVDLRWTERCGIEDVAAMHARVARAAGRRVRLVASCSRDSNGVSAAIAPRILDADHPLASVHGAGNALVITLERGATIRLSGTGAGRFPTTESVIGDLFELLREARAASSDRATSRGERARFERAARGKASR